MAEEDGASPREQLVEACRRDNIELFEEVMNDMKSHPKEQIAAFLNTATDTLGNHLLHICANNGSYDVMNELLDVEFLEVDPLTRREKETPIHCAVKYANERGASDQEYVKLGEAMAKMLVDAGADPRIRDGHGRKPADICIPTTESIRAMLRQEEYILNEGLKTQQVNHIEEDDADAGPPSDDE